MVFITIGYIEWRKGQDILTRAISGLPEYLREGNRFLYVGNDGSAMAQKIRSSDIHCIEMMGTVDRERVHELLKSSDMMICPSREDPMPTVCAEAMMHGVPCIVSDVTGTAAYIEDGVNGLIFRSGDEEMLREKIEWCIANPTAVEMMRSKAHRTYEEVFSMEVFEERLMCYVNDSLNR